jgi:hypothetical protein
VVSALSERDLAKHLGDHRADSALPGTWSATQVQHTPKRVLGVVHSLTLKVTEGGRYYVRCSCGYLTTTRATENDAAGAGVHHVRCIWKIRRESGLPEKVSPAGNRESATTRHPSALVKGTP